ncbi:Uncharacterised protein g10708 [Pycnogonum litorale]
MVNIDLSYRHLESLPEQVPNLDGVTGVNLKHNFLGRARDDQKSIDKITEMSTLNWIILSQNSLRMLPSQFNKLVNLKMLDLSDNHLSSLPDNFGSLHRLQTLLLNENNLTNLPDSFRRLENLEVLELRRNNFSSVPSVVEHLKNLQKLDLSSNMLHDVTNMVCSILRHVDHLQLQKNNIICGRTQTPPLDMLTGVRYLDFSYNTVSELNLCLLEQLQHLNLSHCGLSLLKINGTSLKSIEVSHNELKDICCSPVPSKLQTINISHNRFQGVPDWITQSTDVSEFYASHNELTVVPVALFDGKLEHLTVIDVNHNQILSLPETSTKSNLSKIFLNHNRLSSLPHNFFATKPKLEILNLTNNRLGTIICGTLDDVIGDKMEEIYLTCNYLQEDSLEIVLKFRNMKILHVAYNDLHSWIGISFKSLNSLQELNISGNNFQELPSDLESCHMLHSLFVHQNKLKDLPDLSALSTLKVLDLSNNEIGQLNLDYIKYSSLKYLDISSNINLYVDPVQFKRLCVDRSVEMVDVKCSSRVVPQFSPHGPSLYASDENKNKYWTLGFAEIPSRNGRMSVGQVRMPQFCVDRSGYEAALLCLCDGRDDPDATKMLQRILPETVREERNCPETANLYMKTTILTAIRQMKSSGYGRPHDMLVIHISRNKCRKQLPAKSQPLYVLTIGSVGRIKCILCRKGEPQVITSDEASLDETVSKNRGCCSLDQDSSIPDPTITDIPLEPSDEYLVLANQAFWNFISAVQVVFELGQLSDANIAAKRLANLAQSCGCSETISVIVLRFNFMNTIKRNCLHKNSRYASPSKKLRSSREYVPLGSSCRANLSVMEKSWLGASEPILNQLQYDSLCDDYRSSKFDVKNTKTNLNKEWTSLHNIRSEDVKSTAFGANETQSDSENEGSKDGEAYKSWEYILEQNHKLLFTRQLQTLHRSFKQTKHRMRSVDPGKWCNNHSAAAYGTICHYTNKGAYPTYRGRYYYYNRKPNGNK